MFKETFDAVFLVDGHEIPAHRAWLSMASPVLRKLLGNGMKASSHLVVTLKMFKARSFQITLDLVYCEELCVLNCEEYLEVLECARFYQLKALEEVVLKD